MRQDALVTPRAHAGSPSAGVLVARVALALAAGLAAPTAARGQDTQPPVEQLAPGEVRIEVEGETRAPAYVSAIDGIVRLDREGRTEAAERGMPLVPGDRLRTDAGRVELAFPNGSQVYVDRYSELEMLDVLDLRLGRGRIFVRLAATIDSADRLVIDAPGALVQFDDDGEYRVAVGGTEAVEVELGVLRGSASLFSEGHQVLVPQGHRSVVRDGGPPSNPEWFAASETTLERWAAEREAMWRSGTYASRQYLPDELAPYAATFDQNGSWQADENYGAVWYPSGTSEEWRPYYDGRWDYTVSYGWTWITAGPSWNYPTHHYGRWHTGPRGWFWIPSRHWGPGWVYWAVAPDYVGWCPLGWNGRPVVNVFNYDGARRSHWRDPYRAWTVMPRGSFGRSHGPGMYADRTRLGREKPAFVLQHRAPGYAPPRSPYPSPFNPRLNDPAAGTRTAVDRAPARGSGSTLSPRSYGTYGSDRDSRGGYAAPRDDGSPSPYERARPYMGRPETRGAEGTRSGDGGVTYRRVAPSQAPIRSPGIRRGYGGGEDADDDTGRGGAGYAGPRYRAPGSPGMSRPSDAGERPGMSSGGAGERRAAPRYEPPSRRDDGDGPSRPSSSSIRTPRGDRDGGGSRGGDGGGSRSGDGGSSRGVDSPSRSGDGGNRSGTSGSSRSSSGGAVRRHP